MLPIDPRFAFVGKIIAVVVVMLFIGGIGWTLNGWRLSGELADTKKVHSDYVAAAEKNTREASERYRTMETAANEQAAAAAKAYQDGVDHAQAQQKTFESAVTGGTTRLFVNAKCPDNRGVPNNATTSTSADVSQPELDPAARPSYYALRSGIVAAELKIDGLQTFIRSLSAACGAGAN